MFAIVKSSLLKTILNSVPSTSTLFVIVTYLRQTESVILRMICFFLILLRYTYFLESFFCKDA